VGTQHRRTPEIAQKWPACLWVPELLYSSSREISRFEVGGGGDWLGGCLPRRPEGMGSRRSPRTYSLIWCAFSCLSDCPNLLWNPLELERIRIPKELRALCRDIGGGKSLGKPCVRCCTDAVLTAPLCCSHVSPCKLSAVVPCESGSPPPAAGTARPVWERDAQRVCDAGVGEQGGHFLRDPVAPGPRNPGAGRRGC